MKMRGKLRHLGNKIERMNQVILSFPLWLAVGLSGFFKSIKSKGWKKSEKNENYGKMY